MHYLLTNCTLFTGEEILKDHSVEILDNRIVAISTQPRTDAEHVDLGGLNLAPGFIDLQVNGGGGVYLTRTPDCTTIEKIRDAHRRSGTTSLLPTVISTSIETMQAAIQATAECMQRYPDSVLGLHLEGPFFNPTKKGAHSERYIRKPSVDELEGIVRQGREIVKMITIAPEMFDETLLGLLSQFGAVLSAGHSNATYEQAKAAFVQGVKTATHLYNAMSAFESREPGLVGAILDSPDVRAGIIADGLHCHFASLRIAKKLLGERLFLVSDAAAFANADISYFEFEEMKVHLRDGKCVNAEGKLAGAAITMLDAVQNCIREAGISPDEALRMASLYPARVIGVDDRLGRIKEGYVANLVVLDGEFELKGVIEGSTGVDELESFY